MKIVFHREHFEEHKISEDNLIRLYPYGLTLIQDSSRPTFLLKDETGKWTLPVSLSPIEAGVALQQANQSMVPTTPHKVTELLLQTLNLKIHRCLFVEIKGHHQFVRLFFEGHPTHGSLKVRADEALSLCLHLDVPFYTTKNFMRRSQVMCAEMDGFSLDSRLSSAVLSKNQGYLQ